MRTTTGAIHWSSLMSTPFSGNPTFSYFTRYTYASLRLLANHAQQAIFIQPAQTQRALYFAISQLLTCHRLGMGKNTETTTRRGDLLIASKIILVNAIGIDLGSGIAAARGCHKRRGREQHWGHVVTVIRLI
jgi:hypothetical protein